MVGFLEVRFLQVGVSVSGGRHAVTAGVGAFLCTGVLVYLCVHYLFNYFLAFSLASGIRVR